MYCPSVHTKLFILLGHPLGHSFSPPMHNRLFEKLGMDAVYFPVDVAAGDLETVFRGLARMNVGGFNVTVPHKIRIIGLLDGLDPLAEVIGAVNTICLENGRTRGYNTDGEGFIISLETQLGTTVGGKRIFILGSGGAARGIAMTLAVRGAAKVFLCNRTIDRAEALAGEINARINPCAEAIDPSPAKMASALSHSDILVNATSVGMHPAEDDMPIDPSLLSGALAVADLVYNPLETRLLHAARELGCPVADGLGMLVYQGALAFKLWTGIDPPVDEMFDAVPVG